MSAPEASAATARARPRPAPPVMDIPLSAPEIDTPAVPRHERDEQRVRIDAALQGDAGDLPDEAAPWAGRSERARRLPELARRFGLAPLECDCLAVLWVGAFDVALRARCAALEPYSGQITARSVALLFGHDERVRLGSESALLLWRMVQEHPLIDGGAALAIDPALLAWLEGEHELDRALVGRATLLTAGLDLPAWPVASTAARLHQAWQGGRRVRVEVRASDTLAARWFTAAVGQRLGLTVLGVPPGALRGVEDAAVRLQRQAWLDGCAPCIALADAHLARPPGALAYPLQFLCATPADERALYDASADAGPARGRVGEDGQSRTDPAAWDLPGDGADAGVIAIALPDPTPAEREQLWCALWPEAAAWPAAALGDLALCHEAGVADIAAAAARAPRDAAEAGCILRERSRTDLGHLARRIDATFGWDDLVLPQAADARLREIAFEARERVRLWAEPAAARLFPYGRGLVALFAGPPGTGKTMAAQVIAADLGLDLLAVDLSAVVSKWVGETAQHLQTLLSSRAAQGAVLFFDEADALYARRVEAVRDAQDRFANLDTSHLMTALEGYPGIVLLASNLKGNIDSAFLRRIRHVVDFPKPDGEARERIWQQTVAALFGDTEAARLREDVRRVARIEATGAQIKNAALSAAFAARQRQRAADAALLGQMLARELGKEGAGLSARELAVVLEGEV